MKIPIFDKSDKFLKILVIFLQKKILNLFLQHIPIFSWNRETKELVWMALPNSIVKPLAILPRQCFGPRKVAKNWCSLVQHMDRCLSAKKEL